MVPSGRMARRALYLLTRCESPLSTALLADVLETAPQVMRQVLRELKDLGLVEVKLLIPTKPTPSYCYCATPDGHEVFESGVQISSGKSRHPKSTLTAKQVREAISKRTYVEAAKLLGVSRKTLYQKMEEFGLWVPKRFTIDDAAIRMAWFRSGGDSKAAADILGISKAAFYRRASNAKIPLSGLGRPKKALWEEPG